MDSPSRACRRYGSLLLVPAILFLLAIALLFVLEDFLRTNRGRWNSYFASSAPWKSRVSKKYRLTNLISPARSSFSHRSARYVLQRHGPGMPRITHRECQDSICLFSACICDGQQLLCDRW